MNRQVAGNVSESVVFLTGMLEIRDNQLFALGKSLESHFVTDMAAHVRRHFPERAAGLDDNALRLRIEAAIASARSYGLRSRQECCRFLNIAGACGWDFETDHKYAWIPARLRDAGITSPADRLDVVLARLLNTMRTHLRNLELRREFGLNEVHRL
jgi:hypothetical protein